MDLRVSRRSFLFAGAAAAGWAFADDAKFSSDVEVVNVLASVRDKQGHVIKTLRKEDFTLEDEGKPQTIKYFSQQSDLPLTLGLLIDTSGSQRSVLEPERHASYRFLEQVMRPEKDMAFVIHFDFETELLQDLTSSRKDLEKALEDLEISGRPALNRRQPGQGRSAPGSGRPRGGGTNLYDAVLLASDELMKKQQGRKAVFVLSDGVDTGSRVTLNDAIESAQRADTLIYAIRFFDKNQQNPRSLGTAGGGRRRGGRGGIGFPGGNPGPLPRRAEGVADGKKVLQRMAAETGGGYYEVSEKRTLGDIYTLIEEELRNQYSLGFAPDKSVAGFHKLRISVKDKGMTAQARSGYYVR